MPAHLSIPRLHRPSLEVITREFFEPERPVIITGVAEEWPAFRRWTPAYLKEALGSRLVAINESTSGDYFNADGTYGEMEPRDMPWDEFVDGVFSPRSGEPIRYLRQRPIREFGPLADDVVTPGYVPRPLLHTNIWVGAAPSLTVTHYDSEDNFLVQISGKKEVVLFPSSQLKELYPYGVRRGAFNHSQVDIENPDLARFPLFASATPYRCTLSAGEMLYIPIYWWHQVRTVESGISVNMWWKPLPAQARRLNGLRFLPASLRAGHFTSTFSQLLPETMGIWVMAAYEKARALRRRF